MSMLNTPFATPSRVRGVYRYLLHAPGQAVPRDLLLKMVSPDTLVKGEGKEPNRKMAADALGEGLKIGLFIETGEAVTLNPVLPDDIRDPRRGDESLPRILANLFMATEENKDFVRVGAWFLAQNPMVVRGTWDDIQRTMIDQTGSTLFNMNDIRFGQFEDWFCYLGLGWIQGGMAGLIPEPSIFLKRQLAVLFPEGPGQERPFTHVMTDLGDRWPIFEGGEIRQDVERTLAPRDPHVISASTALALFRLEREGVVKLSYRSDAQGLLLPKGDTTWNCTHMTWLKA